MSEGERGSEFLHKQKPDFHKSREVEGVTDFLRKNGHRIPNNPPEKITNYLNFLADPNYVNDGILTGNPESINRQIDHHVIKTDEIPESYFDLQQRIARERGHGYLQITPEVRREAARVIRTDQQKSLNEWATYLSGNDALYPSWFKLYTFDAVTKMGQFDKEKNEFQKRSNTTTAPYPELSRGALSQVYTWVKQSRIDNERITNVFADNEEEAKFQKALKSVNFAKLYIQAIHKTQEGMITPEQKKEIKGSWKQYDQGSDPELLHGDLQGFGLDWCTATGAETAADQLQLGDFYIYYTKDKEGTDTVPRIAIRMENDQVEEVRGILPGQHLEPELFDITEEMLQVLPEGEKYFPRIANMKRLTELDEVIKNGGLFSDEDLFWLRFGDVEGFGYGEDPRIAELLEGRDQYDDYELLKERFGEEELTRKLKETPKGRILWIDFTIKKIESTVKAGKSLSEEDILFLRYGNLGRSDLRFDELLEGRNENDDDELLVEHFGEEEFARKLKALCQDIGYEDVTERFLEKYKLRKPLKSIETSIKAGKQLTREQLAFIYQKDAVSRDIVAYGSGLSIEEFREQRNSEEDMLILFDCEPTQIAHAPSEINENTKAYVGQLESGIFDKLQEFNIENIYTSFPEGKIDRQQVEIGGKTAEQLRSELREAGIHIYETWGGISDFTTSTTSHMIDIVRLSVKDLGFTEKPSIDQIYTKAQEFGLDLCPAELGPYMALGKSRFGASWIGMKPIYGRGIFSFSSGRVLSESDWDDDFYSNEYNKFVFVLPKKD